MRSIQSRRVKRIPIDAQFVADWLYLISRGAVPQGAVPVGWYHDPLRDGFNLFVSRASFPEILPGAEVPALTPTLHEGTHEFVARLRGRPDAETILKDLYAIEAPSAAERLARWEAKHRQALILLGIGAET